MQVREIMTQTVKTIAPDASVREAAQMMAAEDCGCLPVAQGDRIVGMVTDRDITLRGVAKSKDPDTCTVQEVMSEEVKYLFDDESTDDLVRNFGALQIRRLPVVNREKRLVGIVSLADLALQSDGAAAASALRSVSAPSSEAPIAG